MQLPEYYSMDIDYSIPQNRHPEFENISKYTGITYNINFIDNYYNFLNEETAYNCIEHVIGKRSICKKSNNPLIYNYKDGDINILVIFREKITEMLFFGTIIIWIENKTSDRIIGDLHKLVIIIKKLAPLMNLDLYVLKHHKQLSLHILYAKYEFGYNYMKVKEPMNCHYCLQQCDDRYNTRVATIINEQNILCEVLFCNFHCELKYHKHHPLSIFPKNLMRVEGINIENKTYFLNQDSINYR